MYLAHKAKPTSERNEIAYWWMIILSEFDVIEPITFVDKWNFQFQPGVSEISEFKQTLASRCHTVLQFLLRKKWFGNIQARRIYFNLICFLLVYERNYGVHSFTFSFISVISFLIYFSISKCEAEVSCNINLISNNFLYFWFHINE